MSIVKLFHSFKYRKIPGHNSLWRCPLYSSTICKSWIQLFAVSIFALPNKSSPFRLSLFASEKLLKVYVLHFLDKQWLPEFVLLHTGVWYVFILWIPGIQFVPVTVSFEACSGHKTMMYTLKVGFTILNNLIQHRGLDSKLSFYFTNSVEVLVDSNKCTPHQINVTL